MAKYDKFTSIKNPNRPVQVESAIRDGSGKNIENNYAKQNGYYQTLTVGLSDNLTPYSEDSGASQDNPFISNGTGTNNNTEIVTVGDYGLLQEKQGNSVVVNQLVQNGDFSNGTTGWTAVRGTISANNNICSYIVTELGGADTTNRITKFVSLVANHKYLCFATIKAPHDTIFNFTLNSSGDIVNVNTNISCVANTKKYALILLSPTANITGLFIRSALGNYNYNVNDIIEFSDIGIVDLTQMFNGDIPQDLLDHPEHFSWYYNGSLDYNAGTLDNGDGVKLVSTGRNLWDEEWENGSIGGSGTVSPNPDRIISKNFNKCIPNVMYYGYSGVSGGDLYIFWYDKSQNYIGNSSLSNKSAISPVNACYFKIREEGTTYNNNITISLYYSPEQGGEGYDKYYAYEEPHITNTGNETLRSAGSVKDSKLPSGEIIRRVGVVDLGSLTWTYDSESQRFFGAVDNLKIGNARTVKMICPIYSAIYNGEAYDSSWNMVIYNTYQSDVVAIHNSSYNDADTFKTAMNGVYLFYELAEPTTEQGTAFPENLPINDYGMLYWLDSSDNLVGVPQGCKIFYPVNYKGFIDDVYARTDGDASKLVLQTELSASETARDTVDSQLQNAIGGTLRQLLASSKSIDFLNTDFVDLGTLTWTYQSSFTNPCFSTSILSAKGNDSGVANILSTMYKAMFDNYTAMPNMNMQLRATGHNLYVTNTSYTDATTFKNDMKGVLLAYEKASS